MLRQEYQVSMWHAETMHDKPHALKSEYAPSCARFPGGYDSRVSSKFVRCVMELIDVFLRDQHQVARSRLT